MKYTLHLVFVALFVFAGCGKTKDHQDHQDQDETNEDDPNEALYNQVNELHESVMFKMDDLYKMKVQLEERIAKDPSMTAEKKKALQETIASLDSADHAMKDWMHGWMNSPPDTADTEKTREYFESEMESIKKVGEQMNEAIEKAKADLEKK